MLYLMGIATEKRRTVFKAAISASPTLRRSGEPILPGTGTTFAGFPCLLHTTDESSKFQIPIPRGMSNPIQSVWSLGLGISLGFGNLELGISFASDQPLPSNLISSRKKSPVLVGALLQMSFVHVEKTKAASRSTQREGIRLAADRAGGRAGALREEFVLSKLIRLHGQRFCHAPKRPAVNCPTPYQDFEKWIGMGRPSARRRGEGREEI